MWVTLEAKHRSSPLTLTRKNDIIGLKWKTDLAACAAFSFISMKNRNLNFLTFRREHELKRTNISFVRFT